MPKNKIRESVRCYKLHVLINGNGAVHNVPLQYSVHLKEDFRISVLSLLSEKVPYFAREEARKKFGGMR
jgi:hypothetical protein